MAMMCIAGCSISEAVRSPPTGLTSKADAAGLERVGAWRCPPSAGAGMRTLVTGGGGFIGSHIVERLVVDGHEVRVLDNFATGRRENLMALANDVEVMEGDIQSFERVHNAVRGCEVVYHQAALPSVPRSI